MTCAAATESGPVWVSALRMLAISDCKRSPSRPPISRTHMVLICLVAAVASSRKRKLSGPPIKPLK